MSRMDDWNYYGDERVNAKGAKAPILYVDDESIELPWKYEVCYLCQGKGSHVNPSIDSNGLTAEDFYDDPDFRDNYRSGMYDQPCNQCHGKRVEPVADYDRMSKEEIKAYEDQLQEEAWDRQTEMMERRMGA